MVISVNLSKRGKFKVREECRERQEKYYEHPCARKGQLGDLPELSQTGIAIFKLLPRLCYFRHPVFLLIVLDVLIDVALLPLFQLAYRTCVLQFRVACELHGSVRVKKLANVLSCRYSLY